MATNLKVLQVIPKLGYGGAETGCFDIALIYLRIIVSHLLLLVVVNYLNLLIKKKLKFLDYLCKVKILY